MAKNFKLIVEANPLPVVKAKTLKADEPIILDGVFMEASKRNGNNRTYSLEEMVNAVKEFQPMITESRALAELEHPETTEINPQRACARILELKQSSENKNWFIGKAVVLSSIPSKNIHGTPCGDLLASLLQYGTKVGWSSRGVGEVNESGNVTDFHLCTIDCVLDPSIGRFSNSNGNRFIDGVLESKEFVLKSHSKAQPIFEAIEKDLSHLPSKQDDKIEHIINSFNTFFKNLKGV